MTDKKQGDFADMMNAMQDALTSAVVAIYTDLMAAGVVEKDQAVGSMRRLATHMRDEKHHSRVVGEGVALKLDQWALILETTGQAQEQ